MLSATTSTTRNRTASFLIRRARVNNNKALMDGGASTSTTVAVRFFGGGGTSKQRPRMKKSEEYFIAQALRTVRESRPQITVEVEKAPFTGCNFLPGIITQTLQRSAVRIKCLTHADILSDAALTHQIHLAEREHHKDGSPIAVFALQLREDTKTKAVRKLRDGLIGATMLAQTRVALVCGLPNAGKSSLILPLTRSRTMEVKKKRAYHLPKISPAAGRTLGMKKHVLDAPMGSVTLMDSPGLRPKLEELHDKRAIALLLAARVVEPFGGHDKIVGDLVLGTAAQSMNRHAEINGDAVPDYVNILELDGPTDNGTVFFQAAKRKFPDRENLRMPQVVKMFHYGDFGPMVFGTGAVLKDLPPRRYHRDHPIVYMNEAAQYLCDIGGGGMHAY